MRLPIKTLAFITAAALFIACAFLFHEHCLEIITWVNALGWLAPIFFIAIYCVATILFLPTMVLTLAGGAFFGPILGALFNLLGACCGAGVSFLISRHLVFDWFNQKKGARLNKLITGVEQKGWVFVAFLRIFPVIPFNLVNYGLGLTHIRFRLYMLTTIVFLIPAEIIYTYCGYAGMTALSKPGHFYRNGGMLLTGLALLFLVIIKIVKTKGFNLIKTVKIQPVFDEANR